MIRHLTAYLLIVFCSFCLVGCEYKELCYDHNHWATANVQFDWSDVPTASVSGMTVLFYNLSTPTAEPVRYDFSGMTGGTARLDPGTYRVVAYNYDTETILYSGGSLWNTLEAYTRQSSIEEGTQLTRTGMPRAAGAETEPVILEPDILYGAVSEEVTLSQSQTDCPVNLKLSHRFKHVTITITNVPNLKYTSVFGGALSGVAASRLMASGVASETCATQAFPASVVGDSTLQMSLRIFDHCPHSDLGEYNKHLLTIYAILADGSKWYYTLDITDDMHDASLIGDEEEISITLDKPLPVPKPIVNGSGFKPTVDGWQGEEIAVDM